jgi:hypothetical protein
VKFLELGAGIDAELLDQGLAAFLKDTQCLPLASRLVERQHQLAAQPFPERVAGDERLQLSHQLVMSAQGQVRIDLQLDCLEACLLELGDLLLGEGLEGELRERWAAPQAECLPQQRRRTRRIRGGDLPCLLDQPFEPPGVQLLRVHLEHIAGLAGDDQLTLQGSAEPGHHHLQRIRRVGGQVAAPELIDQPISRDHLAGVDQQDRQQRPLLGPAHWHLPIALGHLQRPKDPELHVSNSTPRQGRSRTRGSPWRTARALSRSADPRNPTDRSA